MTENFELREAYNALKLTYSKIVDEIIQDNQKKVNAEIEQRNIYANENITNGEESHTDGLHTDPHTTDNPMSKGATEDSMGEIENYSFKVKKPSPPFKIVARAIIPSVNSDPRTSFLTYTSKNFYTEDDPILRYIPNTISKPNALINWYEGSRVGAEPLSTKEMLDGIFLKQMDYKEEVYTFLEIVAPKKRAGNMKSLFCNVCLLFNCGIHSVTPGVMLNYKETNHCLCHMNNETSNKIEKTAKEIITKYKGNTNVNGSGSENNSDSFNVQKDVMKHLFCYKFSPCIIKKLLNILTPYTIDCNEINQKKLPIKTFDKGHKEITFMEHFTPCNHPGPCTKKNCSCARKDIPCELSCFCTGCSRMRYCSCGDCTECSCDGVMRFCDPDLCAHSNCKNIYETTCKKASVHRSEIHGFGLFSDEYFIAADDFVMEYTGEVISDKEAERRGNFYEMNNCSYLFNISNEGTSCKYSIDAFSVGNISRYINHSKSGANLRTAVKVVRGIAHIMFYAKRDIYKGEEFLFDYQFTEEHQRKHGMV